MSAPSGARVTLMGVEIDRLTERRAIERILDELDAGRGGWVVTPNLEQLRLASREAELRDLLGRAEISVADGMPLIWASRLAADPLPERVAGSDLILSLSDAAAARGRSVFILGGAPDAGRLAAARLRERNPVLRICGHLPLPMGFDPAERKSLERIRRALRSARPDIVFVGLGFPKQERLIANTRGVLPQAWFLGVGISLSFAAGELTRAPVWMRRAGLEWVHRLAQEPRRLYRRYLLHDVPFAMRLFAHATARRLRRG
jgi:N-acetylglucosaminyldiphosphoundecaprenol N-acetyl-beta-D-mannosaminyltransferase